MFYTHCGIPGIRFEPVTPYKLADLKPTYGYLHQDDITGGDCFGFGDIDIIFGQTRHFITDEMLARINVISTQPHCLSGHFCLMRNVEAYRNAFQKTPNWQALMEMEQHLDIDE